MRHADRILDKVRSLERLRLARPPRPQRRLCRVRVMYMEWHQVLQHVERDVSAFRSTLYEKLEHAAPGGHGGSRLPNISLTLDKITCAHIKGRHLCRQ